ncbi:MAG: ABC transporter permease, partial [Planctomycetales bacterium]|nr:ABC transporter permease [Planctomycetales bacterium]
MRGAGRLPPRLLLAGRFQEDRWRSPAAGHLARWTAVAATLIACGLVPLALRQGGETQAGIFFAAGGLVLLAGLLAIHGWLSRVGRASRAAVRYGSWWLALSNAARQPLRSTLTIGLVATACFLIIAVSTFRLDETDAASGGYNLLAQTAAPVYHDLSSPAGWEELGMDFATAGLLSETETIGVRVHGGQDASCLNLYRARQPRILGLPPGISPDFHWAAQAAPTDNPWQLLRQPLPAADPAPAPPGMKTVPVILDQNTALYSLHLWQGVGSSLVVEDEEGRPVRLQIVALLQNSLFQGDVLMSDEHFLELYPSTGGCRLFLMRAPAEDAAERLQAGLERRLADFGCDVIPTQQRLAELFAVQNTYLSTFQSLGGLGLLLGTFGLGTVQLRNVMARRGELAVMR